MAAADVTPPRAPSVDDDSSLSPTLSPMASPVQFSPSTGTSISPAASPVGAACLEAKWLQKLPLPVNAAEAEKIYSDLLAQLRFEVQSTHREVALAKDALRDTIRTKQTAAKKLLTVPHTNEADRQHLEEKCRRKLYKNLGREPTQDELDLYKARKGRKWLSKRGEKKHAAASTAQGKLTQVESLFREADRDGSGTLDSPELAAVIQRYHKTAGELRSRRRIQATVQDLMSQYDENQSGSLCFAEFATMLFSSKALDLREHAGDNAVRAALGQVARQERQKRHRGFAAARLQGAVRCREARWACRIAFEAQCALNGLLLIFDAVDTEHRGFLDVRGLTHGISMYLLRNAQQVQKPRAWVERLAEDHIVANVEPGVVASLGTFMFAGMPFEGFVELALLHPEIQSKATSPVPILNLNLNLTLNRRTTTKASASDKRPLGWPQRLTRHSNSTSDTKQQLSRFKRWLWATRPVSPSTARPSTTPQPVLPRSSPGCEEG